MTFPIELVLFLFLLVVAVAIARQRNLFAAAMLGGIFTLVCAGIYTLTDAVDVAFTEAAVGSGISTVLFLATLALTGHHEKSPKGRHWSAMAVCVSTGALLCYGTLDMPDYGDPSAPIHHHVVQRYIEDSPEEIGMPNFVTSVLASYRGFDTFGELGVIFTAGMGVMLLLGVYQPKPRQSRGSGSTTEAPPGKVQDD